MGTVATGDTPSTEFLPHRVCALLNHISSPDKSLSNLILFFKLTQSNLQFQNGKDC